jgi:hypothetical protein
MNTGTLISFGCLQTARLSERLTAESSVLPAVSIDTQKKKRHYLGLY